MSEIGIFTDDFYPIIGGIGRHVFELHSRLYHKNNFIVFSPNRNNLKNHIQIEINKKFARNLFFSVFLNRNIQKIINKYHLSTIHFHCGPGGLIITTKTNAKMICTVHHTYYQQQNNIHSQKWKYLFYLLEKRMYQNAHKIIAVSEDTKRCLVENYGIFEKKIKVIPNGINSKIFTKMNSIKKIDNCLLFVGRLDKRKGIDFLIKTIPLVKKEIPDIKLLVIGKGKLRALLEPFIEKEKLENNVIFLGYVPDKNLPIYYNRAQLTIVPSVFEGFGMTALESLASGTPVIGTYTDGIKSLIHDKRLLVKYGDKEELSKTILYYLKTPPQKKFNRTKYSWDRIAKKTLEIYHEK